jgi:hypothetical protein
MSDPSSREVTRLRALEDAVSRFAEEVGKHDPPLIGFFPHGGREDQDRLGAIFRLAREAAGYLGRQHGVGTAALAQSLNAWCDEYQTSRNQR